MSTKVYLSYCSENKDVIEHFSKDVSRAGVQFVHHVRNADNANSIEKEMANNEAPIYLFVSDNFLKSVGCMEGALKFIDNFKFRPRIKPVVIDGVSRDEDTGETKPVPTKFDKVSNVIRYMNHWQDEYLRLRREKRTIPYSEEASFQDKIDRIRRISNEIGDFLRSLRGFNYQDFDSFKQGNFKSLFDAIGFEGDSMFQRYKTLPPYKAIVAAPEPKIEVVPTPPVVEEKIIENNAEDVEENVEEETPKFEIGEIPGLEMLPPDEENNKEDEKIVSDIVAPNITIDHYSDEEDDDEEEEDDSESGVAPSDDEEISQAPDVFQSADDLLEDMINDEEVEDEDDEDEVEDEDDEDEAEDEDDEDEAEDEDDEDEVEDEDDEDEAEDEDDEDEAEDEDDEDEAEDEDDEDEAEDEDDEDEAEDEDDEDEAEDEDDEDEAEDEDDEDEAEDEDDEDEAEDEDESVVIRTPAMILEAARNSVASGDWAVAKENYKLLLTKSDNTAIRIEYAAFLQDKLNDASEAKIHLEELLLQDKATSEVYHRLGLIAEANEEYLSAKNYYERVISVDSGYAAAYHSLGNIIAAQFENQDFVAKSYYQEAIEIDGDNPIYRHDYANFLTKKGEYKKARKQLLEAVDLDEDDSAAYLSLANLYLNHLDKKKKARKYYLKATELNDSLATAKYDALFEVERVSDEAEAAEPQAAPPMPPSDVKTVMVTGATSGIGLAIAEVFAAQGHKVILTGRRGERLRATQHHFQQVYGNAPEILEFDVREKSAAEAAYNSLSEEWQNIDILINNAGLAKGFAPIHKGSLDHWETMIDTNLKGLLYITRLVSPGMVARGKGHIINIGSSAGKEVYPNGNVYCATKFAVDALAKGMRLDLHKHGIKVTTVHPGHVETEFALVRFDGDAEKSKIYNDFQPLTAKDVAEAVVFAATRPPHVNVQDILMYATQQASSTVIDKSGR